MSNPKKTKGTTSMMFQPRSKASVRARITKTAAMALGVTELTIAFGLVASDRSVAQPSTDHGASVLVFPLFDSRDMSDTIISITNTNTSLEACPESDTRAGDVGLRYVYVDAAEFIEFDRFEFLTPGDTLSVLASRHNPEGDSGYLVVVALSAADFSLSASFDALIGSATVIRVDMDQAWTYRPYGFRSIQERSEPCVDVDTDVDADGAIDFDGIEYEYFPRRLRLASFLSKNESFDNRLAMLSLAGFAYTSDVRFSIWNNIEDLYRRNLRFLHYFDGDLSDVSTVVRNLGGDREEFDFLDIESGWIELEGTRLTDPAGNPVRNRGGGLAIPPILAVYVGSVVGTNSAFGHALHVDGQLDGLEVGAFGSGDGDPQQAPPEVSLGVGGW